MTAWDERLILGFGVGTGSTRAGFLYLVDLLTWKATGGLARSTYTVTCKWTYLASENRWDPTYFCQIGLNELADDERGRRRRRPGPFAGHAGFGRNN